MLLIFWLTDITRKWFSAFCGCEQSKMASRFGHHVVRNLFQEVTTKWSERCLDLSAAWQVIQWICCEQRLGDTLYLCCRTIVVAKLLLLLLSLLKPAKALQWCNLSRHSTLTEWHRQKNSPAGLLSRLWYTVVMTKWPLISVIIVIVVVIISISSVVGKSVRIVVSGT